MLQKYHIVITQQALERTFSPAALARIIDANLHQDRLAGQIGHDEYHFDNNAFEKSYAYIEEQRTLVLSSLGAGNAPSAWSAFGRLTHTAQDFYAHTNYIDMWLAQLPTDPRPDPSEADPGDMTLIDSPALRSGKIYLPLEVLTLFKSLTPLAMRLLPRDSHAWMNIDSPEKGFQFDYVMQAAVKRTVIEFEKTVIDIRKDQLGIFVDR